MTQIGACYASGKCCRFCPGKVKTHVDREGKYRADTLRQVVIPVLGTFAAFVTELVDAEIVRQMDNDVGLGLCMPVGAFTHEKCQVLIWRRAVCYFVV